MVKYTIMNQTQTKYLSKYSRELARKHPSKCIAVVGDKIVASGRDRVEAYEKAKKEHPREKMGVFYVPLKNELELLV